MPKLVTTINELRQELSHQRDRHIALIPTMGALHEGHLSLIEKCRLNSPDAFIVVTIFVNPLQFSPDGKDLQEYPRTLDNDLTLLKGKADLVFAPSIEEIYPSNIKHEIIITAGSKSAAQFEGSKRPGHFDGVLTVVAKLFNIVQPDMAFFGQKDAEQVFLIKRMVKQLNFPIEIHAIETKRDPDGLAMSSRNQHLSVDERKTALKLSAALFLIQKMAKECSTPLECLDRAQKFIGEYSNQLELDYLVLVEADSLKRIEKDDFKGKGLAMIAAWVGQTRLIDNVFVEFG